MFSSIVTSGRAAECRRAKATFRRCRGLSRSSEHQLDASALIERAVQVEQSRVTEMTCNCSNTESALDAKSGRGWWANCKRGDREWGLVGKS